MKPRAYVETSIPSFHFETRSEPDMVARRQWTRAWWMNGLLGLHTPALVTPLELLGNDYDEA